MKGKLLRVRPYNSYAFFRSLHLWIALLIAFVIVNANFIDTDALSESVLSVLLTGLQAIPDSLLGLILLIFMVSQRDIRGYFTRTLLDFKQIQADIGQLLRVSLPRSSKGCRATMIQRLRVVFLRLVATSGAVWFAVEVLLPSCSADAGQFLYWHKCLITFIEIYFTAYGVIGIAHIFMCNKKYTADSGSVG
ncbi:cytochrome b/b6 domain-containing protein [Pantoea agglomerans]|uniref:hypothetical protein n=1 Tax=Enterobacter agglomerans TaxID=549 RepID=UPI0007E5413F|nr:hypothetical protein [Pantoea agglomerans]WHU89997.1 cytochrome b/b6 domain-containing protein [Pantoea agglomerans pv. gypsophilae]WNN36607.1 cytochrome b/b6 domain-containing protein [Pantoea agglomerans]